MNLSDTGFLTDPESENFRYVTSDVVDFEAIASSHCLVLLGEPGIGKSTAMHDEYLILKERDEHSEERFLFTDLGEFGEESRLIREVFESEEIQRWKNGDYNLHLYFDSLDECRIKIPQLARIISGQLERMKKCLSRLRLRVACRTGEWPSLLENSLVRMWGPNKCGFYELAPLRQKDVELAAARHEIDVNKFIEALLKVEVVALAIKPITLEFLIENYKLSGQLGSSKCELYELGCNKLCEEVNPNREDLI